ncbi:hypothetical protein [Synechococcus sp. M16CYN]|uniref:hypothetical protein n=1 Tax=Synechococcus sp. M16CYN TaxID=3103139 RepID=UPI00324D497C
MKLEGTTFEKTGIKTELVKQLKGLKFSFRDGDEIFAAEAITHLLQKGAEPLVGAAIAAGIELYLSNELSRAWREHADLGIFEDNKYGIPIDLFINYLEDTSHFHLLLLPQRG